MKPGTWAALALSALVSWRVTAGEPTSSTWGRVTNDVRIALAVKGSSPAIRTNQPLILSVAVQNLSNHETVCLLRAVPTERDPLYSFRVLSPSGKDISPAVPKGHSGTRTTSVIGPHETEHLDFELTKLCQFNEIGTYRIVVYREIWRLSNRPPFIARSSSLRLAVVPGAWEGGPKTNAPIHW